MKLRLKRSLYLVHRWLGVGMCALFAAWFATGIVMMYVEYPELTEQERLATLMPLDLARVSVTVDEAVAAADFAGNVSTVVLSSLGARPAYRIRSHEGGAAVVYADDAGRFTGHSRDSALAAVQRSGFARDGARASYEGSIDVDQWTVAAVLDEHRPLHRVAVNDEGGTVVYLSSTTGQIVLDTHRVERLWNWLGSTIHWIYPFQLRRHADLWTNLLIYLSLAGCFSVATGAVIGVLRLRWRHRYRGRDVSPYAGAAKWHHLLGIACLAFLATFMFSGLMSMTPWGLFDSVASEAEQVRRYTDGPDTEAAWAAVDWSAVPQREGVKEIEWRRIAGASYAVISRSVADREVVADGLKGEPALRALRADILAALPSLVPQAEVAVGELVTDYDDYYYSRHNRYRPLPAYRVAFDDPESTWFYIDWSTGAVVLRYTTAARVQRWLYNGLHSLDFAVLLRLGPGWDALMIGLCTIGFAFAVTAVFVGWRRVAHGGRAAGRSRA